MRRYWLIPAVFLVAAVAFVFLMQSSETFQNCIENAQYKAARTANYKQLADVPITLLMRERCWGDYLNQTGNGIIAFFTIVLAASTIGLWNVTKEAADVSLRQTNAAIAAQSPRMIFSGLKLVRYLDKTGWVDEGDRIDGSPYGFLRPLVCVTNAGPPIMALHQFCINLIVAKEPSPTPNYSKIISTGEHLDTKVSIWLIDRGADCIELSDSEIESIQTSKAFLWMYGWVSISNHLTNEFVTRGFIGRYDPHAAIFVRQGPAAYTFEKRTPIT